MEIETAFILLFVIATGVAVATRRTRVPYTVALVLTGLVLGALNLFPAPGLTKTLLFSVFLPGLVFEAAFHIDFREFRANLITITTLAVPGVVVSTALVTLTLTPLMLTLGLAPEFDWKSALVFGALISATDPVAVVALFRNIGAPRRLTMLLDAESLLNDGTAIVFFTLSLALLAGSATTPAQLTWQFVTIVGGGAAIGLTIGLAASIVTRRIDDPMIEITLTTIAAYGSFVFAETLHFSGVIATVAAGMFCGNVAARGGGMAASTRVATERFWEYVAFALNSIVFLLIGFEVHFSTLLDDWLPILVAYGVVTGGRALMICVGCGLMRLTAERFPWRWTPVLTWGGLRGALPMVLVLSLPQTLPQRELLVSMTYGVALLSILVQGLSMSGLLKLLGLTSERADRTVYEVQIGRLQAAGAALRELDRLSEVRAGSADILDDLRCLYETFAQHAQHDLKEVAAQDKELQGEERQRLYRHLLGVERDRVMQSYQQGALSRESLEKLLADIDARSLTSHPPPNSPAPDAAIDPRTAESRQPAEGGPA